jgi:hypothetical protein
MKLTAYRDAYYTHSGNASSVARQAAFAGIALIWVFNNKTGSNISLPIQLLWPALFLIIGLGLDMLQYIFAAAIWGSFHRIKEKQLRAIPDPDADPEVSAPSYLNWPALLCFWGKLAAVAAGYVSLLMYVKHAIVFSASA